MYRITELKSAPLFVLLLSIFLGGCGDSGDSDSSSDGGDPNPTTTVPTSNAPDSDLLSIELPISITHLQADKARSKVYVSDKSSQRLYIVDLTTGVIESFFQFSYMPERMTMNPDGSRLYLSLLVQEHDSNWDEADQSGYVAVFDLNLQAHSHTLTINIDPYDLVATGDGRLIVSSGSGQWTNIYVYDADTGASQGQEMIYQGSHLSLHPSQNWVFAADTGLSPSDIEKFDISGVGISSLGDSPYHGDYRMNGNIWSTPDGQYVITRGGDIFLATDMTFVSSLTVRNIDRIEMDVDENVIFTVESDGRVRYYDLTSFAQIGLVQVQMDDVDWVFVADDELSLIKQLPLGRFQITQIVHPCLGCGG